MNNIAIAANKLPNKLTKNQAFAVVQLIVGNNLKVSEQDIIELYRFFLPNISKPKSIVDWVNLSNGKNDVRNYINNTYSDGSHLIATDGHRIHVYRNKQPNGWYDDAGEFLGPNHYPSKFPDWQRVLPNFIDDDSIFVPIIFDKLDIKQNGKLQSYVLSKTIGVNAHYVKKALSYHKKYEAYLYDNKAVYIKLDDTCTAYIMGMKL